MRQRNTSRRILNRERDSTGFRPTFSNSPPNLCECLFHDHIVYKMQLFIIRQHLHINISLSSSLHCILGGGSVILHGCVWGMGPLVSLPQTKMNIKKSSISIGHVSANALYKPYRLIGQHFTFHSIIKTRVLSLRLTLK